MHCPNCQALNWPNAQQCAKCGQQLLDKQEQDVICGSCQAQNPAGSKYCNECGKSMQQEMTPASMEGKAAAGAVAIVSPVAGAIDRYAPRFIRMEPGTFMMGSPEDEPGRKDTEILHEVILTQAFEIAETPLTQEQYRALLKRNPSFYRDDGDGSCPVENVSWNDAAEYCNRLSELAGLQPSYRPAGATWEVVGRSIYESEGYRLPTEAEWEYAARAGTRLAYYGGEAKVGFWGVKRTQPALDRIGWYDKNSGARTHPVKEKEPNAWGLYDMSGNVGEWCHDWWVLELGSNSVKDPFGSLTGKHRVYRGGSYGSPALLCRSAARSIQPPNWCFPFIGFRPVRTLR